MQHVFEKNTSKVWHTDANDTIGQLDGLPLPLKQNANTEF